jgi:hypothetical protein
VDGGVAAGVLELPGELDNEFGVGVAPAPAPAPLKMLVNIDSVIKEPVLLQHEAFSPQQYSAETRSLVLQSLKS